MSDLRAATSVRPTKRASVNSERSAIFPGWKSLSKWFRRLDDHDMVAQEYTSDVRPERGDDPVGTPAPTTRPHWRHHRLDLVKQLPILSLRLTGWNFNSVEHEGEQVHKDADSRRTSQICPGRHNRSLLQVHSELVIRLNCARLQEPQAKESSAILP